MEVIDITIDNKKELLSVLPEDVEESIGRKYYRGKVLIDGSKKPGCIVWEYKNANDKGASPKVEIVHLCLKDASGGAHLFDCFDSEMEKEGIKKSQFELSNEIKKLSPFLKERGFQVTERESRDVLLSLDDLKDSKVILKRPSSRITPLSDVAAKDFRQGIMKCLYAGRRGLCEDLSTLSKSWYEQTLSCGVKADDELKGLLLIHHFPSGILMPLVLFADGPDAQINILEMLRYSARTVISDYDKDTKIMIRRDNPASLAIMNKLFPGKKGKNSLYGVRELC